MTLLVDDRQARSTGELRAGGPRSRGGAVARLSASHWRVSIASASAVLLAALSLSPLLTGGWWFARTAVVVGCLGVAGWTARFLRVPAPLVPLLQFAVLVELLTLLFARVEALWGVVPGPGAVLRLREIAAQGADYAAATRAPAGPDEGLLLLIVAGVGLIALAVDTLATGLDLPGMTLIPLGVLFIVPWTIGGGTAATWAFAATAVGWLAVVSALQSQRAGLWSPGARSGSPSVALVITAAITGLAILAGGLTTLRDPLGPATRGSGSAAGSVTLDPLVSMRRSLVSNDPRPVITFTTTADRPEYFRLAILEKFDGERWEAAGPNRTSDTVPVVPTGQTVQYRIEVKDLGGSTVPSPAGTFRLSGDWPVRWDVRTELPQRADDEGVQDSEVDLEAVDRDFDQTALRAGSAAGTTGAHPDNLADPTPQTGERLPRLARRITADAATPFDAALALQRWFTTDDRFEYSTAIDGGSGGDALDAFLDERVGYCEQFAATMALMARSVGIPARVAVGFTHGRPGSEAWVVRGTDAHAWPELWMGSAGWVRFEPTPAAATTSEPLYTQGDEEDSAPTESGAAQDDTAPDETAQEGRRPDLADGAVGQVIDGPGVAVGQVIAALLGAVAIVPAAIRLGRRQRRTRRGGADAAYAEIVDTFVDLGFGQEAATPRATLALVADVVAGPESGPDRSDAARASAAVQRIRHAVEWQRYGSALEPDQPTHVAPPADPGAGPGSPPGDSDRRGGWESDLRLVRRALSHRAPWPQRVLSVVFPRSVVSLVTGWAVPSRGLPAS